MPYVRYHHYRDSPLCWFRVELGFTQAELCETVGSGFVLSVRRLRSFESEDGWVDMSLFWLMQIYQAFRVRYAKGSYSWRFPDLGLFLKIIMGKRSPMLDL